MMHLLFCTVSYYAERVWRLCVSPDSNAIQRGALSYSVEVHK